LPDFGAVVSKVTAQCGLTPEEKSVAEIRFKNRAQRFGRPPAYIRRRESS